MQLLPHLPTSLPAEECARLFHGRGHCFPGLEGITLDWLPPSLLLTQFSAVNPEQKQGLIAQVTQWWQQHSQQPLSLVWQNRSVSPAQTESIGVAPPATHWAQESGLWFELNLMRGQNHGLFLDMLNGRRWVQQQSQGKKVLNLFAYTCGFSVYACAGGASEVVNLDMSKPALAQGKRNHSRNGFDKGVRYLGHDLFKTFGKLKKLGPFDLVVVDPPSFQQGSFIATKDYPRLLRRLPEMLNDGGEALLCLNAPELSRAHLMGQVSECAPQLQFIEQIANPASFPEVDIDKGLKVMRYRLLA
ncbi:class I SAM-dependent methyltransferase [uncultured Ferrimonas sp.]|uniref:class I SAM-dependent methyltransferase n=1 Tax=uncultured Ferrimonas sp. TaxID=432640 RepID=UPI002620035D|nr:class I SAM-dependent methyltransferase [uncultured Ferrimonas sp.]